MGRLRVSFTASTLAVVTLALVLTGTPQSGAFTRISYTLSVTRPTTHLFEVSIALQTAAGEVPSYVDLQMPMWQPGRYSNADFAKNVQEFTAEH